MVENVLTETRYELTIPYNNELDKLNVEYVFDKEHITIDVESIDDEVSDDYNAMIPELIVMYVALGFHVVFTNNKDFLKIANGIE